MLSTVKERASRVWDSLFDPKPQLVVELLNNYNCLLWKNNAGCELIPHSPDPNDAYRLRRVFFVTNVM